MVLNKEKKEDVFASFNIDKRVANNEANLKRIVLEAERSASERPAGNGFPGFELDEAGKSQELRLKKAKPAAEAGEEDWEDSDSIRPTSRQINSAPVRRPISSSLRGIGNTLHRAASERALNIRNRVSRKHAATGEEEAELAIDHKGLIQRQKKKHGIASRSGTTITTTVQEADDEDYDSEENDVASVSDDDIEKGEDDDGGRDDSDDDSIIDRKKLSAIARTKRTERDVITRSSTGMLLGGMLASGKNDATSPQPSDYRWISPHSADTIFNDFDIDAIVKDYEKMHRKTHYNIDDAEEEEEDENALGITVRYRNLKEWWLDNFPRTHGVLFRILFPLMIVGLCSWYLGWWLATLEKGEEIASNDAIIRSQHTLTGFSNESLFLISDGPTACMNQYLEQKLNGNGTSSNSVILSGMLDTPVVSSGFDTSDPKSTMDEIKAYMKICSNATSDAFDNYRDYKRLELEAAAQGSLTFNWIRCWDTKLYGHVNPINPTRKQLAAAANQSEFYYESWLRNQSALYDEYLLEKNITGNIAEGTFDKDAYDRSVEDATGSTFCAENKAASAWFFFVVMTTVGYGNVSPVTSEGQLLVAATGWFTIIVWAILLYIAGRVLGIIIDDMFRRCNCRKLTGNFGSAMIWLFISFAWIVVVAELYVQWYNRVEHPDKYRFTLFKYKDLLDDSDDQMSYGEAFWFSYISLLTVGLGDYSIGPESFFTQDLMIWMASFLIGFTLISTFLGQVADLTNNIFPDSGNHLKERLLNTSVVGKMEVQYKRENEKGIEKLEKLVEIMDDDDMELIAQRVTRIRVKKNLLVHLLHQTHIELEHYKKRGERYENLSYAAICTEENMLSEVSSSTRKERIKQENYRMHSTSDVPGSKQPYFDDGTTEDVVEAKLKLRQGQKSARKNLKASWYT